MRKYCLLFVLLISLIAKGQFDSIYVDNLYRSYIVHLPPSYDGSVSTPLIIGMHGGFGNAGQFEAQSLLSDKSDQEGFIAVYPNGTGFNIAPNLRFWNAGTCCGYPNNNNIDDVGFISALIDSLTTDLNIDTTRVYATGMSNGAFMTYALGCELNEQIAAIAPVAGGLLTSSPCTPARPMPIIHFHSYLDSNSVYYGGVGNGISDHYNPPVDSIMDVWSGLNACSIIRDTLVNNIDYTHIRFADCDCLVEQQVFITQDGGHSWPGGNSTQIGDPVSIVINANDEIWDFFQQHSLECLSTGIEERSKLELAIVPNPNTGNFSIKVPSELMGSALRVLDASGRIILERTVTQNIEHLNVDIPSGIYLVLVQMELEQSTIKMMIE